MTITKLAHMVCRPKRGRRGGSCSGRCCSQCPSGPRRVKACVCTTTPTSPPSGAVLRPGSEGAGTGGSVCQFVCMCSQMAGVSDHRVVWTAGRYMVYMPSLQQAQDCKSGICELTIKEAAVSARDSLSKRLKLCPNMWCCYMCNRG